MIATVVGMRSGTFKDKKDPNKTINFAKIYVTSEDDYVKGVIAEGFSVKPEMLDGLEVGELVEIRFNRYGKPDEILPA